MEGWGATANSAAIVLTELHPGLDFDGGGVEGERVFTLFRRDPWIAFLQTDFGARHAVIVDGLQGDVVRVREPWGLHGVGVGLGSRATIRLADFLEHWHWSFNNAVFPCRRKK